MAVRLERGRPLTDDLKFVQFETSDGVEVLSRFDDMNLGEDLIRGIYAYGFERPSAIQQRAIKLMTSGHDVIAQAPSGAGKTATISIAMLQSIDKHFRDTQVLCLSPTRELDVQIRKVILGLGDYLNVHCHACIGGTSLGEDLRKLDFGDTIFNAISKLDNAMDKIETNNFSQKKITDFFNM